MADQELEELRAKRLAEMQARAVSNCQFCVVGGGQNFFQIINESCLLLQR